MNVHRWFLVFVLIVEALIFSLILFYYSERFVYHCHCRINKIYLWRGVCTFKAT